MTKKTIAPRQELFCREYLVDLNAKQAAIRLVTASRQPKYRVINYYRNL